MLSETQEKRPRPCDILGSAEKDGWTRATLRPPNGGDLCEQEVAPIVSEPQTSARP